MNRIVLFQQLQNKPVSFHELKKKYHHSTVFWLLQYRVSQKTWELSDEFDIVFVMN